MKKKKFVAASFMKGLIAGAVLAAPVFYLGYSRQNGIIRSISDACFVAAALILGVSGFIFARNGGTFDMIGYSFKAFTNTHFSKNVGKMEDIVDYKERKASERRSPFNMMLAGLVWLALSVIFLIIYFQVKPA